MAKSIFEQGLKQKFKENKNSAFSDEEKKEYRLKTLNDIFLQIGNKENKFVFYCPDIVVVNDIVRVIYDVALTVHNLGYNVVMLHEINGFKCKWIEGEEYKKLHIDYVIQKPGKKSKKEKHQYSFKPSDTLIVPDVFQEVFENTYEVKLIQKVLLVTGYSGLAALPNGINYNQLNVSAFLFLEEKLKDDYVTVFPDIENASYLLEYKLDKKVFDPANISLQEIYPVIAISNIGNVKFSQQVINIFYNLYPNLNVFSFKLVSRNNYEEYVNSIKHSCLYVNLDEMVGFKKPILEAINMGVNVATFDRRELSKDTELIDYIQTFSKDPFEAASFLAQYCIYWLSNSSSKVLNEVNALKTRINLDKYSDQTYLESVKKSFSTLQENRVKFFSSIKTTIEKNEDAAAGI